MLKVTFFSSFALRSLLFCALLVTLISSLLCSATTSSDITYRSWSTGCMNKGGDGNDAGRDIILTRDNGNAMVGYTETFGSGGSDAWFIRTSLTTMIMQNNKTAWYQKELWNKTYGGPGNDGANEVIQTWEGYVLAGYTNSSVDTGIDMWLIETDDNGEMQWNMTYGGEFEDVANCVIETDDGGFLLAGFIGTSNQTTNAWLVKTDRYGVMEWNQTYDGLNCNKVIETSDGNYAFEVQYANAFGLTKINSTGGVLFNQVYPAPYENAKTQSVIQTDDGYVIVGPISYNTGINGSWLIKTNSEGNVTWNKIIDNFGVNDIIVTQEGGFAMTGSDACLIVTDSSGNIQLEKSNNMGETFIETYAIIETSPLHFSLIGQDDNSSNQWDTNNMQLFLVETSIRLVTDAPIVNIISPQNGGVYPCDNVPLTFFVSNASEWMAYALDGPMNVTITGNTTLPTLTEGTHTITVYALDTSYAIGSSEPVTFSSETITFQIIASTQQTPTTSPTEDSTNSIGNLPDYQTWLIIGLIAISAAGLGIGAILFYNKKKANIKSN